MYKKWKKASHNAGRMTSVKCCYIYYNTGWLLLITVYAAFLLGLVEVKLNLMKVCFGCKTLTFKITGNYSFQVHVVNLKEEQYFPLKCRGTIK